MTPAPDLFSLAQSALSASTTTSGEIAAWYVATARLAFTQATEKLQQLERMLIAREAELAHAARPKSLELEKAPRGGDGGTKRPVDGLMSKVAQLDAVRLSKQRASEYERGKKIAIDAAEIILQADARIGELTREMAQAPHAKGAGRGKGAVPSGNRPKSDRLEEEGLTKKQAAECERVAALNDDGG